MLHCRARSCQTEDVCSRMGKPVRRAFYFQAKLNACWLSRVIEIPDSIAPEIQIPHQILA